MIPYRTMADDATPADPRDNPIRLPGQTVFQRLADLRELLERSAAEYLAQTETLYRAYDRSLGRDRAEYTDHAWRLFRARQLGILTEMQALLESVK